MKSASLTLLFLIATLTRPLAADIPQEPLSIAVLDFQTAGDAFSGKGGDAASLLDADLSANPGLVLVERQELEKILGEQSLGLGGLVSPETAAKIGQLTGAKVLVSGRMFEAGGKYFLVAKIMSAETGRVYGEMASFAYPNALEGAVKEVAGKISDLVDKSSGTLVAKVEDPSSQIERLKKLVAGKKLPTVSVSVKEQHITRFVIDPAVETELVLALRQIGFTVIDPKVSNQSPDVTISGEAFSEYGARFGNLVSCRARVEIKIVNNDTHALLLADRQTDAGVDLSENTAAKKALQNAARKLLDRIVPKLIGNP